MNTRAEYRGRRSEPVIVERTWSAISAHGQSDGSGNPDIFALVGSTLAPSALPAGRAVTLQRVVGTWNVYNTTGDRVMTALWLADPGLGVFKDLPLSSITCPKGATSSSGTQGPPDVGASFDSKGQRRLGVTANDGVLTIPGIFVSAATASSAPVGAGKVLVAATMWFLYGIRDAR